MDKKNQLPKVGITDKLELKCPDLNQTELKGSWAESSRPGAFQNLAETKLTKILGPN